MRRSGESRRPFERAQSLKGTETLDSASGDPFVFMDEAATGRRFFPVDPNPRVAGTRTSAVSCAAELLLRRDSSSLEARPILIIPLQVDGASLAEGAFQAPGEPVASPYHTLQASRR
jgi:hypothetical protein